MVGKRRIIVLYCTEMLLMRVISVPEKAAALFQRSIIVDTGVRTSFLQVMGNMYTFMAASAAGVCTLLFLLGAAQLTVSKGDQTKVDNGKKLMVSALIGLAIILGSYGIIRTILYFLYEWAP